MKKIIVIILCTLGCFFIADTIFSDDIQAHAIMKKANDRDTGDNIIADMEMELIDISNNIRIRKVTLFQKKKDADKFSLRFFQYPEDVKDTAFLTYEYDFNKDKEDDQWMYIPALKTTKRIASTDKSSSFMGSDLNIADLTTYDTKNFNYSFFKDREVDVKGAKTWCIEAIPINEKVCEYYGYSKIIYFVRQDNYVIVRSIHWINKTTKIRYMDTPKLDFINGIWVKSEIDAITKKGNVIEHKTVLRTKKILFNQNINYEFFTVRQLEKGI